MTDEQLIEKTNKAISELVYDKTEIQKAYNYYNGIRDEEQFRYLEENYGIGNPTSVEFTPLIRKHIDALVGEYLGMPTLPKVSCKDSDTISKITREKQLKITQEVVTFLQSRLKNKILEQIQNKQDIQDVLIKSDLENIIEDLEYDFVSDYEIAAQNVVQYLMQSRETDFKNKKKHLLLDLLIAGYMCYRTKPSVSKNNVKIDILDPRNTFFDINPESVYLKDSYRVVVRRWLTKSQILNEYGHDLSRKDIKEINDTWKDAALESGAYYVRTTGSNTGGLRAGEEIMIPGYPNDTRGYRNLIPVYEVEWLETDSHFVMQRYKTIRIGQEIFILIGKDDSVVRSMDNPNYCNLSVNGIYNANRSNQPYSLVLACVTLQDKYDLLNFYRDNLIASSGTVGDIIDVSVLPKFLGTDLTERVQKALAWKKQGAFLIDSSQEGRLGNGQTPVNTIYNGYDDTIKVQAVQAIQLAMDSIEQTCSSITGVFRERLNGIQQKDAVTNVQTSVNNSFIISKQWYQQMDTITEEILLDALNEAKIVFKNGLTGTLILGDKQVRVFTALPEHFTMTDYDIHITSSADMTRDTEQLKALVPELIKAGQLDAESVIDLATTKSTTEVKVKMHKAIRKQKKENSQIQQLGQQLQQAQQLLQQMQSELQKAQQQVQSLNQAKLQLEQSKLQQQAKIDMYKAQTDRSYKEAVVENDKRKTNVEIAQLSDNNPYNDEIKN